MLLVGACSYICSLSASKAGDATIKFNYNVGPYSYSGPDGVDQGTVGGEGSFTVPTGLSTVIGLNDLSSFNFGLSVTSSLYGDARFTSSLSGLNAFSFNLANYATSLSLNTAAAQASPSVTAQGTRYYPEAFSTGGGVGKTEAVVFPSLPPTPSSTGTVTINSSSLLRAVLQDALHVGKNGATITAELTPNFGLSLKQAAAIGGYAGFNWVQIVTHLPEPNPFKTAAGLSLTTPFNDPPPGGYSYMAPSLSNYFLSTYNTAYPFYYGIHNNLLDPYDLRYASTNRTLSFLDSSANQCLFGGSGGTCGGLTSVPGEQMLFSTYLVGYYNDGYIRSSTLSI